jgi:Phage-related protein
MMQGDAVGIFSGLLLTKRQAMKAEITAAYATTDPSTLPIASPWSSSTLERIVAEDVFGSDLPVNTRAAAMRLPALTRARNLLVSTICRLPLVQLAAGEQLPPATDPAARAALDASQPTWLYRCDDGTTPQHRLAWTVDDLIFYGWSCWWRVNGSDGFPLSVGRVNQGDWTINSDNVVEINGVPQQHDAVIVIPGLHEGILTYGRDALDDTRTLYRNVRNRLATPTPGLDLHQTDGRDLTDPEIDALITRWSIARKGGNGGVSYTNKNIVATPMEGDDGKLMIEARNAAALDLARLVGVSGGMIDATTPKASLNYETTTGRNQEFVDFDLALYLTPITARLSLDDVVPRGKRVVFDLSDFTGSTPSPTGPASQD